MEKTRKNINKFLTFYHEFRIPKNQFFLKKGGGEKHLLLSSPSRMGNHALISMLDSHPQIPKIPGEDAFLTWAFIKANYDVSRFLDNVRDINYIKKMSSDSCLKNKWLEHKKLFHNGSCPEIYNGVQYDYNKDDKNSSLHRLPDKDSFVDFQGVILDVDYDNYHKVLSDNKGIIEQTSDFTDIFTIYSEAFRSLLNGKQDYSTYCADYVYACSGMRVQSLWALRQYENTKLIVSIRRFESYAISMIKSFYKTSELREEFLKEAWEQWYHKVIDYLYLKLNYPEKVLLVDFDDIINESEFVSQSICRFLGIDFHESMLSATINGVNVKGNSSVSRKNHESGVFYKSTSKELDKKHIPDDYYPIWEIFNQMKYDGVLKT